MLQVDVETDSQGVDQVKRMERPLACRPRLLCECNFQKERGLLSLYSDAKLSKHC